MSLLDKAPAPQDASVKIAQASGAPTQHFLGWLFRLTRHIGDLNAVVSRAGVPTAADIPAGTFAVVKDTTGGTLKLYANDSGTIRSVTLT